MIVTEKLTKIYRTYRKEPGLWGAVKGLNPDTGREFDDTKHYVESSPKLTAADRAKIFEGNARKVFPRLGKALASTAKA